MPPAINSACASRGRRGFEHEPVPNDTSCACQIPATEWRLSGHFWTREKVEEVTVKLERCSSLRFFSHRNISCASECPHMNGIVDANSADGDALFVLVAPVRPVGLTSKRAADIILALCGIVVLAPFLIFCCLAIACFSPGPVLFRHRRVGFNGKHFDCLKFRTMATDASERLRLHLESDRAAAAEWMATRKLRNDPRVT